MRFFRVDDDRICRSPRWRRDGGEIVDKENVVVVDKAPYTSS